MMLGLGTPGVDPGKLRCARLAWSLNDLAARERRRRENARTFRSNLDPGDPFHKLTDPTLDSIVYYGGRDARKSWAIAEHLVKRSNRERRRVLCTREFQASIKDSVHTVLRDMIERLGMDHRFRVTDRSITNPYTGSEFIFKGLHHNVQEIKSTEAVDDCWVAEAQNTTDESWDTLIPTIRKEGAQIIVDFNVTDEEAATYRRYVKNPPPKSHVQMVNYDSNPFLSSRSRAAIAWLKEHNYEAYLHIYRGVPKKFSDSVIFGGRYVIEGFPRELATECIRAGGRIFYGLDHGFAQDPYALVRFFIHERKLYIEDEAFGVGVDFAGQIHEDGRGELEQLLDTVPDSRQWPIMADNSRPETISFLCQKGFQVHAAEKWTGCEEDGVEYIKSFEKIVIHERCKHMQEEARLYSYKVDPKTKLVLPVIVHRNGNGWDAIRYGLDGYIRNGDLALWAKLAGNA